MGKPYVIQHCVKAHNDRTQKKLYQIYVTDCLRGIARAMEAPRYADLIRPPEDPEDEETRSQEEIVSHVFRGFHK